MDYAGTQYGEDVRRTLSTKKHVVIPVPVYTPEVLAKHAIKEARRSFDSDLSNSTSTKLVSDNLWLIVLVCEIMG